MSTLTLRQSTEADIPLLVSLSLDERGIRSPGFGSFLCYEKKILVGVASGRLDVSPRTARDTTPLTAHLDYLRSLLPNRLDIIWALVERHAQNGLDNGHTLAEIRIPYAGQCTNVMDTPTLVAEVKSNLTVRSEPEGFNTVTEQVSKEHVYVDDLTLVREQYATWLDKLRCKRVWA